MAAKCKLGRGCAQTLQSQICLRIKGFEHSVGRRPLDRDQVRPIFGPSSGAIQENFRRSRRVGRVGAESDRVGAPPVTRCGPEPRFGWLDRPNSPISARSTVGSAPRESGNIAPMCAATQTPQTRMRHDSRGNRAGSAPDPWHGRDETVSCPTFSHVVALPTGNGQRLVAKLLRHAQHTPNDAKVHTH